MLDLYFIGDEEPQWQEPIEEYYLGSLKLEDFQALERFWSILDGNGIHLSFFEDTRLKSKEVSAAHDELCRFAAYGVSGDEKAVQDAIRAILKEFTKAIDRGKGIMAFCD